MKVRLNGMLSGDGMRKFLRAYIVIFFYFLTAAAFFSGFYSKYGLRDTEQRFSIEAMLNGIADRPSVYRQLVPALANALNAVVPASLHARLSARLTLVSKYYPFQTSVGLRLGSANQPLYAVRYLFVYGLSFLLPLLDRFHDAALVYRVCASRQEHVRTHDVRNPASFLPEYWRLFLRFQ